MSLSSFAKEAKSSKLTYMDKISELHREEAIQGFHDGVAVDTIRRWLLTECGYPEDMFPKASQFRATLKEYAERSKLEKS